MRIVAALGGNALLRRSEPLTLENQRRNVRLAAKALLPLLRQHEVVITHGNGPQVGLLAMQGAEPAPLDMLDAESAGMIGYLVQQELGNLLPPGTGCVTLLTQVEVDAADAAFAHPAKPIGPVYGEAQARGLAAARGWRIARDGAGFRRVVASPQPKRILELAAIELLMRQGVVVVCAGGGGIPVARQADGSMAGVEAVIDKDAASACLARQLKADALLLLTDVDAVYVGWGGAEARPLRQIVPQRLRALQFAPGSMAPKVEAACLFVEQTGGRAGIGRLQDAAAILDGGAGTLIAQEIGDQTA